MTEKLRRQLNLCARKCFLIASLNWCGLVSCLRCPGRVFHTTDVLKKNDLLYRAVRALARISSFGFLGERALQVDAYCGSVLLKGSGRSSSS